MIPAALIVKVKDRFTADWRQIDWGRTALLVLLILAAFSALWQYAMPEVRTITTAEFRRVNQIKVVEKIRRVQVPCPEQGIVALDKQETAARLGLNVGAALAPPAFGADATKGAASSAPTTGNPADLQVTATADLPESDNGIEAVSVIDMRTGESAIVAKEKPAPWVQFRNDGAVGIRYGINHRLEYIGTAYGKWDFLRMKNLYLSAYGDIATGSDARLQLGAEYRW